MRYSHYVVFSRRFLRGNLKGIILTGQRFGTCSMEQALSYKRDLESTPGILEVSIQEA